MQTIRNNLATIVAGIVVVVGLIAAFAFLRPSATNTSEDLVVVIHDGDGGERRLPLAEDATVEVKTSLGTNIIAVEDRTVRVREADCPKGSCTQQEPIDAPGQQLICLPHQLWVEIVPANGQTSELDPDAVVWGDETDVDLVAR